MKELFLFSLTFLGAFTLYILNLNRNRKPFSLFRAVNVKMDKNTKPLIVLLDCLVTSLLGAAVVFFVTSPATNAQAVMSGLGFSGVISAYGKDEGS